GDRCDNRAAAPSAQEREGPMRSKAEMYARPAAERFVDKLDESIAELKQRLDKWADDFKVDPTFALKWSHTTFEQAAQWRVLVDVRNALTSDRRTLEQIRDIAYENALMNNVP